MLSEVRDFAAEARLIDVPAFTDERGTLAVVEFAERLPFQPARFYYIFGAEGDMRRAGHAHWKECEAVFAIHGAIEVTLDDGRERRQYTLDQPNRLLLIPPRHWHEVHGFRLGSICAVFASHRYDPSDYCHVYDEFLRTARA